MLTQEIAARVVSEIYKDRAKDDKNTKTLANIIRSLINDTLSGDKYIAELLQNADDARSPAAQFAFFDNYLVFTHQGKHFDEDDFVAICDAASPERAKVHDSDQIGNKGVGFKSVFTMASVVTVISKHLCFRFDEHYEGWRGRSQDYPWQIIPISTDPSALPMAVRRHCDADSVHFIFLLRPEIISEIQRHLSALRSQHLLFLRSIRTLSSELQQASGETKSIKLNLGAPQRMCVDVKAKDDFTIEKVQASADSAWWVYKKECVLPQELRQQMSACSTIPDKYKTWVTMPISIAINERSGRLVSAGSSLGVFCYLPTGLNFSFNFVCNAEFLLDSSRMQLRSGPVADAWNLFILKSIIEEHLRFLSVLSSRAQHWRDVFTIMTDEFSVPDKFKMACQEVFQESVKKFSFVCNMPRKYIKYIAGMSVDQHDFIQQFGDDPLKEACAHPDIDNKQMMVKLGAKRFQSAEIIAEITQWKFLEKIRDPKENRRFLEFMVHLAARLTGDAQKQVERVFEQRTFILNNKNQLKRPTAVYFQNEALEHVTSDFDFIETVHPTLVDISAREWLSLRGVKSLTLADVIEMANKSKRDLVRFTLCLVDCSDRFDEQCWEQLKTLNVIVDSGDMVSATHAYLPDHLNPGDRLGCYLQKDNSFLLHSDYCQGLSPEKIVKLRIFLLKIGVSQKISAKNLKQVITAVNGFSNADQLIELTLVIFDRFLRGEEVSKEVIKNLEHLKVVCNNDRIVDARECYLADCYEPEVKLQTLVPALPCVSDRYGQGGIAMTELKNFFLIMGVQKTVRVEVISDDQSLQKDALIKRDATAQGYFDWLERTVPNLYYRTKRGLTFAHYLNGVYVHISFVTQLLATPVFWRALANHWDSFSQSLSKVKYDVRTTPNSSCSVSSNIHYLAELAIQRIYGRDKLIKDFFGCDIRKILGVYANELAVADVVIGLNPLQLRALGFKTDLSLAECQRLLTAIAAANKPTEDFQKIIFIYQNLLRIARSDIKAESLVGLQLLNRRNQFLPASSLHYIVNDGLADSENAALIRKPEKFPADDFLLLCKLVGVKLVQSAELVIKPQDDWQNSELNAYINARLQYIVCAVAYKNDWIGVESKPKCKNVLRDIQDKQSKLRLFCSSQCFVEYGDFLREPCDIWIDEEHNRVFHVPLYNFDHQNQDTLYQFLFRYFDLKCEAKDFISIMTSSEEKLRVKFASRLAVIDFTTLEKRVALEDVVSSEDSKAWPVARQRVRDGDNTVKRDDARQSVSDGMGIQVRQRPTLESFLSAVSVDDQSEDNGKEEKFDDDCPMPDAMPSAIAKVSSCKNFVPVDTAESETKRIRMTMPAASVVQRGFFAERMVVDHRAETSREGERAVYHALKQKHTERHGAECIAEYDNFYVITFPNGKTKKVTWMNMQGEANCPYDIEVVVSQGSIQKIRHIEVKTTTSRGRVEIYYSAPQWQQMQTDSDDPMRSHRLIIVKARVSADEFQVDSITKRNLLDDLSQQRARIMGMKIAFLS